MELIATARFKKAMDRATAATAYTRRITQLVRDLAQAGLEVSHPLLEQRDSKERARLMVLTANRGLCGGYNTSVLRAGLARYQQLRQEYGEVELEVSGKRGIAGFRFRRIVPTQTYLQFDDRPGYDDIEQIANRALEDFIAGRLDRLDVAYTRFDSIARQQAAVETLLPLGSLSGAGDEEEPSGESMYEFFPSAESILEEVVPVSFKIKLFKCFLDAAVSEQVARMIAMKSATENASKIIKQLSMTYNRARQSQITGEIMEIIGGVEALK